MPHVKTGWYIPSVKKFIWKLVNANGSLSGISLGPSNINTKIPNKAYWTKLVKKSSGPAGKITILKSDSGHSVYLEPSSFKPFIYNDKAEIIHKFSGIVRVRKEISSLGSGVFVNVPNSPPHVPANSSPILASKSKSKSPRNKITFMYTKTNWFHPEARQFIYASPPAANGYPKLVLSGDPSFPVPNEKYWSRVIRVQGMRPKVTLTTLESNDGFHVYIDDNTKRPVIFDEHGFKIASFDGLDRVLEEMEKGNITFQINAPTSAKKSLAPKTISAIPPSKSTKSKKSPVNLQITSHKSNNGKNVYKNIKGQLYVFKNGKWTAQFKGKAKVQKSIATAVVQVETEVPDVPTSPSHTKATPADSKFQKLGLLLKAVAKKKAALKKEPAKNQYQEWIANKNRGIGYIQRTNRMMFKTISAPGMGESVQTARWKDNLDKPQFFMRDYDFSISYNAYQFARQLLFHYYPIKNFSSIQLSGLIDLEWFQRQNKFIRTLSAREIFLMFGYSHNGDTWAHAYLDGRFDMNSFKTGVRNLSSGMYFALFFQARDFYKINTGDMKKDYDTVLTTVKAEVSERSIKAIIEMFITELNALILKAPVTTKPFVVFRGVKNDTYMTGIKDKQYVLNRFASTSINGEKALGFGIPKATYTKTAHTLQRILITPGTRCLCMFGFTAYAGEFEILLPRGSVYVVRDVKKNATSYHDTNLNVPSTRWTVKNLVDIILLGMSKKYLKKPKTKKVEVEVPVPVVLDPNVIKAQKILNGYKLKHKAKLVSKIGQGGYGTVFKGINSNGHKLAVKFQKNSNNAKTESEALKKLKGTLIAPERHGAIKSVAYSKNFANLVPKGLANTNKGFILQENLIEGKPLRNYMTGQPLGANLKQHIKSKVNKMHRMGVIHGNLHRNNIIINEKGNPWLIDFGKALFKNSGGWKNTAEANAYLKGLGKGYVKKYNKVFYYSNNAKTRSHQANGNFLARLK